MDFLRKAFGSKPRPAKKDFYVFQVRCKRCGEVLEGRVDMDNDLSVEYESGGDSFYTHKVLMGDGKNLCFQQIEVGLKFDSKRKMVERRIESGGDFVD